MIKIINKADCCGCEACIQICPKSCIVPKYDDEGFLYPYTNEEQCVDCNLCTEVCPILSVSENEAKKVERVIAAINKDEEMLNNSSSGGVFIALCSEMINRGGVVYGASFDENWNVVHSAANSLRACKSFMGSKYVQSSINNIYRNVQQNLIKKKDVFFSGTPCQVAGLKRYLRKDYRNLYVCDFVCHGVPSPGVWVKYVSSVKKKIGNIYKINFRNKKNGWRNYCLFFGNSQNKYFCERHHENLYMKVFLQNINLRPSCFACQFKSGKSGSDITLADYWNIWNVHPEFNDENGVSMVIINSEKGNLLFGKVSEQLRLKETDFSNLLKFNKSWNTSPILDAQKRKLFYKLISRYHNLDKAFNKAISPFIFRRIKNKMLRTFRKKSNH
nr:Coenzyme F420 hydrogenase/dehydrogenase, beta subunit C-terminal domain [uncultured Desulfobacter sp.]